MLTGLTTKNKSKPDFFICIILSLRMATCGASRNLDSAHKSPHAHALLSTDSRASSQIGHSFSKGHERVIKLILDDDDDENTDN